MANPPVLEAEADALVLFIAHRLYIDGKTGIRKQDGCPIMAEHSPATSGPATSGPAPLRSALKSDGDGDRTPPASGTLKGM